MRYDALDSWRGICATMVMIYHFAIASHFYTVDFIRNAYLFVDFFFVLSGFVIAINYQDRLMSGFGVGKFMLLRFGRVWPLHAFMLGCFILLELVVFNWPELQAAIGRSGFDGETFSFAAIGTNLLLVHSLPGVHEEVTWNGPSWSISVEFYSYLIFAVGVAILAKLPRSTTLLVISMVAILLAAPVVIYNLGERQNIFLTTGGGLVRCIFGFAAGVLAAMIFTRWKAPIMRLCSDKMRATVLELVMVSIVILFVDWVGITSYNLVAPYLFLLVILVFAPQGGWVSWGLTRGPLLFLGALSYSIYLVHYIVQAILYMTNSMVYARTGEELFTRLGGYEEAYANVPRDRLLTGDAYVIGISILVIALSAVTYNFIEKPGRDFVRGLVKRRPAQKSATIAPAA